MDQNPATEKAFHSLTLFYAPRGNSTITATVRIDNFEVQSLSFQNSAGADLLGVDFILGSSVLSTGDAVSPFTQPIDGIGRGIQFTLTQTGTEEEVEIQGYAIEYEILADRRQEVVQTGGDLA